MQRLNERTVVLTELEEQVQYTFDRFLDRGMSVVAAAKAALTYHHFVAKRGKTGDDFIEYLSDGSIIREDRRLVCAPGYSLEAAAQTERIREAAQAVRDAGPTDRSTKMPPTQAPVTPIGNGYTGGQPNLNALSVAKLAKLHAKAADPEEFMAQLSPDKRNKLAKMLHEQVQREARRREADRVMRQRERRVNGKAARNERKRNATRQVTTARSWA